MDKVGYDVLRKLYKEELNIPPELVDILSVNDMMLMCVTGASTQSISSFLDIDEEYVAEVLRIFLDFAGWESDLEVNPYKIYTGLRVGKDFTLEDFSSVVRSHSPNYSDVDIERMFKACSVYYDIEKLLDSGWI